LSLACNTFQETNKYYPSGGTHPTRTFPCSGSVTSSYASWTVLILPFIEQNGIYQQLKLNEIFGSSTLGTTVGDQIGSPANQAFFDRTIDDYQCPTDPRSGMSVNSTHYFGVQGGGYITANPPSVPASEAWCTNNAGNRVFFNNGIMYFNSKTKPREITDGISKTFLIGESKYQNTKISRPDAYLGWSSSDYLQSNSCRPGVTASVVIPLNSFPLDDLTTDTYTFFTQVFGSFHVDGCHFALADGSVLFVNDGTDLRTLHYFGRRNDNNVSGELQ
jgi:hypothetical protein